MTREEIMTVIAETIALTFGVDAGDIDQDTCAFDIAGWDSLSHTVLMLSLEQRFGFEISAGEDFEDVGALASAISSESSNRA